MNADVQDPASLDAVFGELAASWGKLDFVVHAIAYSDKGELTGRYADTSRDNFLNTMDISCYSFTEIARRASQMMPDGGSLVTMTYLGAQRVMPNYNVMVSPRRRWKHRCAIWRMILAPMVFASTRFRQDR